MDNNVHFGKKLKELIESQDGSVALAYAKLGYKNQEALYPVLKKEDVNTALLKTACQVYEVSLSYFLRNPYEAEGRVRSFTDEKVEYIVGEKQSADKRIAVLESEKKGLEEQIKLLREMVDMLKERDK